MIEGYGLSESPCGILFSRAIAGTLAVMHELSVKILSYSLAFKSD